MRALRRLARRLASSFARRSADERLQEEIEQHLAFQTEENIRAGMTPAEARRQAVLKFGAIESIREAFREEHRLPILETTAYDLRHAIRQLRRSPMFTVTAVLSLAVGIGANAAVVTIADRVLVRSLPVTAPGELIFVADQRARADSSPRFSYPFYAALADNSILAGLAARFVLPVNVGIDGSASRVRGELVSGTYFGVLGAAAHIGRPLTAADDRIPGSHPVAVIGAGLWKRSFGSDPGVLGRTITINNHPFSIVGVADRRFTGTEVGFTTDVWIPMAMQKEVGRDLLKEPRTNWLEMVGRLKPGQSAGSAAADLTAYLERPEAAAATAKPGQERRFVLLPAGKGFSPIRRELGPSLQTLVVLTGLALVLACINVASLLVVRSVAREQEFAVRLALGARRSSLIRQVLTETIVLAILGGAAGLTIAPWAAGLLLASQPDGPVIDSALDLRVFGFGFAVSMLSALLVGLAPVLVARKVGLSTVRGDRADATLTTRRSVTVRDVIVTGQVAVSLVMLISAALFVQSLRNLHAIDTGFDSGDLLLMSVDPGSAGYDPGRFEGFWREALDRTGGVRGVRSVSIARIVPFAFGRQRQPFQNPASGETLEIDTNFVGPAYFRTLNVAMLAGREFDERDGKTSAPVAIVNDRLARLFWPGQDPIGRSIRVGPPGAPMSQIVGVVRDMKYRDLRDPPVPMIYVPIFQTRSTGALTLHVRTDSAAGAAADIRRELQALDRNLPLFAIRTLDEQVSAVLTPSRQAALVSTGFGILALLLSAIGVYGVSALAVSRQTHEIGIRMALGAQPWQIARGIRRRGLVVVAAGLGLGALGAYGFTRTVSTLLYGVSASDATTFAAAAALLAAVAVTAISVPVRTAMRLDAVKAIRYQ
jgi:predicted permease